MEVSMKIIITGFFVVLFLSSIATANSGAISQFARISDGGPVGSGLCNDHGGKAIKWGSRDAKTARKKGTLRGRITYYKRYAYVAYGVKKSGLGSIFGIEKSELLVCKLPA